MPATNRVIMQGKKIMYRLHRTRGTPPSKCNQ